MKESYKIPASLGVSYLDMEIPLRSKNNVGLSKPVSLMSMALYIVTLIVLMLLLFQTPLQSMNLFYKLVFSALVLGLATLLVSRSKSKQFGFSLLLALTSYYPKASRRVRTAPLDSVVPLQNLYNIDSVDPDIALITFKDGTIGRVFKVVGTASQLMFERDKLSIVGKVDRFYRRFPVGTEIIYDTLKEPQQVRRQVMNSKMKESRLISESPGLKHLYEEQRDVLTYGVGTRFKSIHQYAILKAPNEEALNSLENEIRSDSEGLGVMFRGAEALNYEDTKQYFKGVFNYEH